jgi:hypothetical protein
MGGAAMDSLLDPRLELIARRYAWWRSPADAVADPHRLVAQVMALGTWEDAHWLLRVWGRDAFLRVLQAPPPGVLDARAWRFWHLRLLGAPRAEPRPPGRRIPGAAAG